MSDAIDDLCKDYGFDKMLKRKKAIVSLVTFIFRTYEVFYGEPSAPPIEIVKKIIRIILEVSPQSTHLRLSASNLHDQVIDRVVERLYKIAEGEIRKSKIVDYVS